MGASSAVSDTGGLDIVSSLPKDAIESIVCRGDMTAREIARLRETSTKHFQFIPPLCPKYRYDVFPDRSCVWQTVEDSENGDTCLRCKGDVPRLVLRHGNANDIGSGIGCVMQLASGELASASHDGTIKLWNAGTGECTQTHSNVFHDPRKLGMMRCLVQLESGQLASGSYDEMFKLWDPETLAQPTQSIRHNHGVGCVAELEPGQLLATGSLFAIHVWEWNNTNTGEWKYKHSMQDQEEPDAVFCITKLASGKQLASGGNGGTIVIWDPTMAKMVKKLHDGTIHDKRGRRRAHTHHVSCLVELASGKLASGSYDGTIKLWDVGKGECVRRMSHWPDVICRIAELAPGKFASTSDHGIVLVWDEATGKRKAELHYTEPDSKSWDCPMNCVVQLESGELAAGSENGSIAIWSSNPSWID